MASCVEARVSHPPLVLSLHQHYTYPTTCLLFLHAKAAKQPTLQASLQSTSSKSCSNSTRRDGLHGLFHSSKIRQDHQICNCSRKKIDSEEQGKIKDVEKDVGVVAAIALLEFYKREISPYIPGSCRYVPTCSEYAMQSYKAYGFFKGTVLTIWRIVRCNPWGGSGFDPPRWFDEY